MRDIAQCAHHSPLFSDLTYDGQHEWRATGAACTDGTRRGALSTEPPTTPSERPCTQLTIGSSGQHGGATMSACSLAAVGHVRKHDGLMAELASGRWWHHGYRADTCTAGMARRRRGVTACSGMTRVLQPTWPCCAGVSAVHASSAANFCSSMTCCVEQNGTDDTETHTERRPLPQGVFGAALCADEPHLSRHTVRAAGSAYV